MKIVHVIARFNVGGTATWIVNLSHSLIESGHQNYVLAGEVQNGEKEDSRFANIGGIRIKHLGRRISVFSDFLSFLEIRRQIKFLEPDIVNTHTAKAGVVGRLATLSLGRSRPALAHTIHGHLFIGYFNSFSARLIGVIERLLSKKTDVLLFAGKRVKDDCLSKGIGVSTAHVVVMPGIEFQAQQKNSNQRITVGWLARLTKVKRPDRVIELAKANPDLDFLLGGGGELKEACEKAAPFNCRFTGWVNPELFWSWCDIALLTSDNEALPISLIEAQFSGLPCITTPAGSASEVVIKNENGFVTEDFAEPSLDKYLKLLARDQLLMREMGRKGKERANKLFSPERQMRDHLNAYELAISRSKK